MIPSATVRFGTRYNHYKIPIRRSLAKLSLDLKVSVKGNILKSSWATAMSEHILNACYVLAALQTPYISNLLYLCFWNRKDKNKLICSLNKSHKTNVNEPMLQRSPFNGSVWPEVNTVSASLKMALPVFFIVLLAISFPSPCCLVFILRSPFTTVVQQLKTQGRDNIFGVLIPFQRLL